MKIFTLIVAVMIVVGLPVSAKDYEQARDESYQDAAATASIKKNMSACDVIGMEVAEIFAKRLNGVSMSDQMAEPNFEFFHFVIRDAYEERIYIATRVNESVLLRFRDDYEVECNEIMGTKG